MLKNHFKIFLRNLRKHPGYALINLFGLTTGLTCFILISLFVRFELSYDNFHVNADRIFRVAHENSYSTGDRHARTPHPLAPALTAGFNEVQSAVRFRRSEMVVRQADQLFTEEAFYFADADVFEVFSFQMLAGDPATALADPYTLVITESIAQKYFGENDPQGQVLVIDGLGSMTVTGVLENVPANTHFSFDILASYATLEAVGGSQMQAWDNFVTSTYVMLRENADLPQFEARLATLAKEHLSGEDASIRFFVDPLARLYLHASMPGDLGPGGDARQLYLYASIAIFILLIACFNFVSLFTTRSIERVREIGVRKALGAGRRQLIGQFLTEVTAMAGMALVAAVVLVKVVLPAFNALTGKAIDFPYDILFWLIVLGISVGVGLLAACYPAFVLTAFQPTSVLKGQIAPGSARAGFRKVLVVGQFGLCATLLIGMLVMADQLAYLRDKDIGFDKERVVVIPIQGEQVQIPALKAALQAQINVVGAAASYHTPGGGLGFYNMDVEGIDGEVSLPTYIVDYDFIQTLGMEVSAGRTFSEAVTSDAASAFMVNESAVRKFGWDDPLGKRITWDGEKQGVVIGVVKDFHYQSLHQAIEPLVLHVDPIYFRRLSVRLQPAGAGGMASALASLEATYRQFYPDHPFRYSFLEEDFALHYTAEQRTASLVRYGSLLAMIIAGLGLMGLASFTAERRTKEIGVRKVLGASTPGIMLLLLKDFGRLVLLGIVIACPAGLLVATRWLEDFAYHVDIGPRIFVLTVGLTLMVALLAVFYQSIRAALVNPVNNLRYE